MKKADAMRVIAMLVETFPLEKVSEERLAIICAFLADVPLELGMAAAVDWVATEDRFPSIAQLRTRALALGGRLPPDLDEAWDEVQKEIRRVGSYRAPHFSHPAIAEAVRAIGWGELCRSTNGGTDRAHFNRYYQASSKRATRVEQRGVLVGAANRVMLAMTTERKALPPSKDSK